MAKVQLPEWAQCLFLPSRYKAIHGGRGGSKSHSVARALLLTSLERPVRILCCREIQLSIRDSVKLLLDDLIGTMGFSSKFHSLKNEIAVSSGAKFFFCGLRLNPEKIRSYEGIDIVWVEEAHTVSQNSLNILTPTIRKEQSELWFTFNRRRKSDPVDNMFLGEHGPPPDSIVRKITFRDNPWFPQVLRNEMEWDKARDFEKYQHVWEGELEKFSEALVFKNWTVQSFDTPEDARFYFGADWGFSVSPTALIRCFILGRTLFFDYEVVKAKCEIDKTPDLFDQVPESRKWVITADNSRPETNSYMRRAGFRIRPSKKGKGSVEEGVKFLQSYDIVIHPRCVETQKEFAGYEFEVDPLTNEVLPILKNDKNHIIDGARYALEDLRRKLKRAHHGIGAPPQIIGADTT